ncbi:hypothetical protein GA0074692_1629 [Micromonospora pallida]|uniref:Uncharacterized protein n=1 Tax=Micromonospora pallida TaxID=145854 RepID=A0A1C6S2H3_9ACTN|nr:hypothetical protein [Micromonospora pallida]SCL23691.1 hypothetical protein GA0074692_1629 [Micromonospora pallida]
MHQEPVDRRAAVHPELRTAEPDVAALVDVEAGLHDILLPTRYDELAGDLADLVDPEAGLAALVGTDPPTVPSHVPSRHQARRDPRSLGRHRARSRPGCGDGPPTKGIYGGAER